MTQPVTRKDKKAATREALRQAAMQCFARKGYAATSIAEITSEAQVAKGTFYVHFEDKATLIDEQLVEFNEGLAERLRGVIAGSDALTTSRLEPLVRAIAVAFSEHWLAHAAFVRAYAERSAAGLDVAALPFGLNPQTRAVLVAAIQMRAGARELRGDVDLAVHAIVAMWLRLGLQLVFRADLERGAVIETLVVLTTGAVERLFEAT